MFQNQGPSDKAEPANQDALIQYGKQRGVGKPITGPPFENHAEAKKDRDPDDHLRCQQTVWIDALHKTLCQDNQECKLKSAAEDEEIPGQVILFAPGEIVLKYHHDASKGNDQPNALPKSQTISRNGKMRDERDKYWIGVDHNGSSACMRQVGAPVEADDLRCEEETYQEE